MLLQNSQQSLYRCIFISLMLFFVFLQYQLWLSDHGVQAYYALKSRIGEQSVHNDALAKQNHLLSEEVASLYRGEEAFDYHARMKYGLVKKGDHYYSW